MSNAEMYVIAWSLGVRYLIPILLIVVLNGVITYAIVKLVVRKELQRTLDSTKPGKAAEEPPETT